MLLKCRWLTVAWVNVACSKCRTPSEMTAWVGQTDRRTKPLQYAPYGLRHDTACRKKKTGHWPPQVGKVPPYCYFAKCWPVRFWKIHSPSCRLSRKFVTRAIILKIPPRLQCVWSPHSLVQYLAHFDSINTKYHWKKGLACLEGKGENYQVCSVQYCVQQLCTVRCTHIWTD